MSKQAVLAFILFLVLLVLSVGSTYFYLTRPKNTPSDASQISSQIQTTTAPITSLSSPQVLVSSEKPHVRNNTGTGYITRAINAHPILVNGKLQIDVTLSAAYHATPATGSAGFILSNNLKEPNLRYIKVFYWANNSSWNFAFHTNGKNIYQGIMAKASPKNAHFLIEVPSDGKSVIVQGLNLTKTFSLVSSLYEVGDTMGFNFEVPPHTTLTINSLKYATP